jgi:hypothetical protein
LEEWSRAADTNINQAQTLPADSPLRIIIQSNARLISSIQGSASAPEMELKPEAAKEFLRRSDRH